MRSSHELIIPLANQTSLCAWGIKTYSVYKLSENIFSSNARWVTFPLISLSSLSLFLFDLSQLCRLHTKRVTNS